MAYTDDWLRERIARRIPCATCNALVDPERMSSHFLTHAHYMDVHGWDEMAAKWRRTYADRAARFGRNSKFTLPLAV